VPTGSAGVCWKPPGGQSTLDVQREISELLEMPDAGDTPSDPTAPSGAGPEGAAPAGTTPDSPAPAADTPDNPAPAADTPDNQSLAKTGGLTGVGELTQTEDAYGFRWLLLHDTAIDDLVTRVHLVNSTLTDNGWGPQLLCSVFGLVPGPDAGTDMRPLYLVYLYKRGTFYPFAPDGKEHRNNEYELRVRGLVGSDLPIEPDLSRWFPLWDLPVH
jgi:hypothetical protein